MKVPDKIYVCIPQRLNASTFKEDSKYVGIAYMDRGNLTSPQIEEYIRKDALLEWLEQNRNQSQMWFDRYHTRDDLSAKQVWEEVIDKINSM